MGKEAESSRCSAVDKTAILWGKVVLLWEGSRAVSQQYKDERHCFVVQEDIHHWSHSNRGQMPTHKGILMEHGCIREHWSASHNFPLLTLLFSMMSLFLAMRFLSQPRLSTYVIKPEQQTHELQSIFGLAHTEASDTIQFISGCISSLHLALRVTPLHLRRKRHC